MHRLCISQGGGVGVSTQGHGMLSSADYKAAYANCNFTCGPELRACPVGRSSAGCEHAMAAMDKVGAYNIYNIYDTCGNGNMSRSQSSGSESEGESSGLKSLMELLGGGEPMEEPSERAGSSEAAGIDKESALFSDHRAQLEGQAAVTGGPPYSWRCGKSVSQGVGRQTEKCQF
jgi:hypothetical protein